MFTQCWKLANWLPLTNPLIGDGVQSVDADPWVTRWVGLGGGTNIPIPTAEGDVIQADAALQWIAAPIDGGQEP